eukprot:CAMPEP_0172450914 /NCGR_PEP_ID=MMETSP1065-20121228/9100_1 /TAXON_ID=265537 /ORGANISM="Amphiprora paludosa, Strain CCMP125" /LENGTH=67 /DNA_ID=CAMNT_0013202761 /DNA_START=389 /DNA_END=589 /DNA_ORIENTATION=-
MVFSLEFFVGSSKCRDLVGNTTFRVANKSEKWDGSNIMQLQYFNKERIWLDVNESIERKAHGKTPVW